MPLTSINSKHKVCVYFWNLRHKANAFPLSLDLLMGLRVFLLRERILSAISSLRVCRAADNSGHVSSRSTPGSSRSTLPADRSPCFLQDKRMTWAAGPVTGPGCTGGVQSLPRASGGARYAGARPGAPQELTRSPPGALQEPGQFQGQSEDRPQRKQSSRPSGSETLTCVCSLETLLAAQTGH